LHNQTSPKALAARKTTAGTKPGPGVGTARQAGVFTSAMDVLPDRASCNADIFESYNQPSSDAQWGNQYQYGNPTRPGPVPSQPPPRRYTAPVPPHHAAHPYNPYHPHPQSDPVVPQHPPHFSPSNAGESGYPNSRFEHGSQPRAFAGSDSTRGPHNAKPSRRETNPFVRLIEDQQRNPEKPRGYFQ
jgi:hypothetical protein